MSTTATRLRVAICVCTYKRPDVLRRLLDRLVIVAADAREAAAVEVVVVDDDPERSAADVARLLVTSFERGLRYYNSASGNIAVARNHALEMGLSDADWLAIIDDDCMPAADWLRQLFLVQHRYDAECVTGACVDLPPPDAPRWLTEEPFLEGSSAKLDGAVVDVGHLKNTLVSATFLRTHGILFDVEYGRAGCEDVMFFYALGDAGIRHRHAASAEVAEEVPMQRTTLRYQLRRRLWYGNTEARTSIASGRARRGRIATSGVKLAMIGAIGPLTRVVRRRRPQLRWALGEVLQGLGRLLGAAGIFLAHR